MIGGLLSMFSRQKPDPEPVATAPSPRSSILPAELVAVIESTAIIFRQTRADDPEAAAVVVWAAGLGRWPWNGVDHASKRIAKVWPDLTEKQALRAAHLLAAQIRRQGYRQFEAHRPVGMTTREMLEEMERNYHGDWR